MRQINAPKKKFPRVIPLDPYQLESLPQIPWKGRKVKEVIGRKGKGERGREKREGRERREWVDFGPFDRILDTPVFPFCCDG